jgi:anti-anti-sigma factor
MTAQRPDPGDNDKPALEVRRGEDGRSLTLSGELDLATAQILQDELDRQDEGDITLDLAGLEFMDSTGIKLIISTARTLEGRGVLILRSPAAPIRRVLDLVQIDRVPNVKVEGPG